MKPYRKCTVLNYTYAYWTYRKLVANERFQNQLWNEQGHRVPNTTNNLLKTLMLCLSNIGNNSHLKHVSQGWNTRSEMDQGNTIEYNTKSHQVKTKIVNCTYVWLKRMKILTSHRRYVCINENYVTQLLNFKGYTIS